MTAAQIEAIVRTTQADVRLPIQLPAKRRALAEWGHAWGFTKGAEIGVWEGQFAEELCQGCPGLQLLGVDPWRAYPGYDDPKNDQRRLEQAHQTASERLRPYGVTLLQMTSLEAAPRVENGSLDLVYLDANHSEAAVAADLRAWAPKVRPGGVIAGHDYVIRKAKAHLHVKPAVDAYVQQHAIAPWFVLTGDKSPSFFWVVR